MTLYGRMIDQETLGYPDILKLSKFYEELGFYQIAPFDHFYPVYSRDSSVPLLECWTLLAALARDTETIRLGPHVTSSTYRHPGVVAKMAATIDRLSDGRLVLGIGAGWYEREHEAFGIPFGRHSERLERLNEFVELIKSLLIDPETDFHGRYFSFSKALSFPKPLQEPHPPILIGTQGGGEEMLTIISRHANIANIGWNLPEDILEENFEELRNCCRKTGRDPGEIMWSTNLDLLLSKTEKDFNEKMKNTQRKFSGKYPSMTSHVEKTRHGLVGTIEECAQKLEGIKRAGVKMVYLQPLDLPDLESIKLFADKLM